jgi:hypothetical protein
MKLTLTLFNKTRVNGQQLLGGAAKTVFGRRKGNDEDQP